MEAEKLTIPGLEKFEVPGVVGKPMNQVLGMVAISAAISLKRIADALEKADIGNNVYNAISNALIEDLHRR